MKLKLVSLILVLTLSAWAQNAPSTTPDTSTPDKTTCACCSDSGTSSHHACCHGKKGAKDAACCHGKDAASCCGEKAQCMKGDGKAVCCGTGNSCKEGAGCCSAKKGETVAMACCSGNHCERHKLNDADNVAR